MMDRKNVALFVLALACLAWAASCIVDDGDGDSQELSFVRLELADPQAIPADIEVIDVYVTGPGMDPIHLWTRTEDMESSQQIIFDFSVRAGDNRTFAVTASLAQEVVAYEGSQTVDLEAGEEKTLNMTLSGRAYIYGRIMWVNPDSGLVDGPLANHNQSLADIPLVTDDQGNYEVRLLTRTQSYRVEVTAKADGGTGDPFNAFALVTLTTPGERIELDLFLVPLDDDQQPWLCAVFPKAASPGNPIELFGRGFVPQPEFRPLVVVFNPGLSEIIVSNMDIIDDGQMRVDVPALATSGNLMAQWMGGEIPSNEIPFEVF